MNKHLLLTCLVLAALYMPDQAYAQFNDPRTYDNTPVGINQIELGYTYVHANASIDAAVTVLGAKLNLNQGIARYTRYASFLHHLMWVEVEVPVANLAGSITGTNISRSTTSAGDSSYGLAMLLKGGPSLSVSQFQNYKPTTTLGVSLSITAPTGQYNPNKILNLGSDRWAFKPEIALSHPFGPDQRWEFDTYANVSFFTNNTSYHGKEILRQEPLPGLEGHISYSLNDNLWVSFDTRYAFRGTTFIDGVDQNNAQQNFILGSEMNVSLNPRNSLVFNFAKALIHQNGPTLMGFSVKYQYTWGKGTK